MHDLALASPMDGVSSLSAGARLIVSEKQFGYRWSLRIRNDLLALGCRKLEADIDTPLLRVAHSADAVFLRLSPDEWLVLGRKNAEKMMQRLEGENLTAVEITHRQFGLAISGPASGTALAAFCPLDLALSQFPVGACTRTLFARSEITLWRTGLTSFHLEAWRSYASYIMRGLQVAAQDIRYFTTD